MFLFSEFSNSLSYTVLSLRHTDICLSASSSFSTFRATMITLAPFSARSLPIAFPIPWEPPVITTVLETPLASSTRSYGGAIYLAIYGKLILALEAAHSVIDEDNCKETKACRAPEKTKRHKTRLQRLRWCNVLETGHVNPPVNSVKSPKRRDVSDLTRTRRTKFQVS